jgi:hypothetical protein
LGGPQKHHGRGGEEKKYLLSLLPGIQLQSSSRGSSITVVTELPRLGTDFYSEFEVEGLLQIGLVDITAKLGK